MILTTTSTDKGRATAPVRGVGLGGALLRADTVVASGVGHGLIPASRVMGSGTGVSLG